MKTTANIVAILLGAIFIVFGLNFWLHFIAIPQPPEGTPAANFIGAMYGSGYLALVKVLEVIGGLLLVLPRVRNWGLVIIGAIVFNIACIHQFMLGGLKDPLVIFSILACLFLAYVGRQGFCCLACCGSGCCGANCCKSSSEASASCCASESSSGCCGEKK